MKSENEFSIPNDVNVELWFIARSCGERDYLAVGNPHTFPGRMTAFCPHKGHYYNVSVADVADGPQATRWWARGFVVGSEPGSPLTGEGEDDPDSPEYEAW